MQLRHLRYFIAVAEEGSVLRAAQRLHVAQPSISKQIQDMEREIGCPLFDRLARGVRLTPAGVAFLQEAQRAVESAARAIESARNAQGSVAAGLTFAAGRLTYYPPIVTQLLAHFRAENPECDLRLRSLTCAAQKSELRAHTISAAVAWQAEAPESDFGSLVLRDCPLQGVLLPAAHPLARQSYVTLPQLRPLTRLHHSRRLSGDVYRHLRMALLARGLDPVRHRAVPVDVTSVGMHLAAGNAFILASDTIARAYTSSTDAIVYRRFIDPPIPMSLNLFWRSNDESSAIRSLVQIAAQLKPRVEAVA